MPIFEYRCSKCGKIFEKLILGRHSEAAVCPDCGSRKVTQQLSRFSSGNAAGERGQRACAPGVPT